MGIRVAIVFAALASVTPLQSTPPARSATDARVESVEIQLARARTRFQHTLAEHGFRRDDTIVVQTGRDLTGELIPLLADRTVPHADVVNTLTTLASDALGPYLSTIEPRAEPTLALAYLRARDDPGYLARVVGDPVDAAGGLAPGGEVLLDFARHGRASVAPSLRAVLPRLRANDRERVCQAAAFLPAAVATSLATSLLASLPADPPPDADLPCVILAARTTAGRVLLLSWIDRFVASHPPIAPRWVLGAVLGLAGTEQRRAAERAWAVVAAGDMEVPVSDQLLQLSPSISLDTQPAREFAARIAATTQTRYHGVFPPFVPMRLRARDAAVVTESLHTLENPNLETIALRTSLLVVGLATPESGVAAAHARLVSLREQTRAMPTFRIDPREVDAWIDAFTAVSACRGARACLADLIAHGSNASAARAIFTLGPAGLASLDEHAADALVQRLSAVASPALLGAFAFTVRGCPSRLRGAVEARGVSEDPVQAIRPYYGAFVAACEAGAP